ncbi:MAG: Spore coat protein SA [Stenotrophomonas maltophilia]|nr:MAG: Spore coat protein SA [Stenotrophomonas maltophilia]
MPRPATTSQGQLDPRASRRINLLLIHQNFPGQFRHLAQELQQHPGYRVQAIARETAPGLSGIHLQRYHPARSSTAATHPYLLSFESAVLHGQQVARVLLQQRTKGYRPDVILAHPGWGETLFIKDIYPETPLIHFCEYYYRAQGADADFDPEFPLTLDRMARIRVRNSLHLLNLEQCDLAVTPIAWQHSLHPTAYQEKIRVIHEGIQLPRLQPDANATLQLPNGRTLKAGQPVITYVARNLEPYRGFHRFMRALPRLLARHPTAEVVIVGADGVSYGQRPVDAPDWRSKLLAENPLDLERVHFLGRVPYATYRRVLQVSAAHVYLTYPFVLSWSMLEAMACGCLLVGSDTAPVREVIEHGRNGYLVDFFDEQALIESVLQALEQPERQRPLRAAARRTAERYSSEFGCQQYRQLLQQAIAKSATSRNSQRVGEASRMHIQAGPLDV